MSYMGHCTHAHTQSHTQTHTHINTKRKKLKQILQPHYSLIRVQHNFHCFIIEKCNDLINMHVTGQIYACMFV